jgi:type II secretory pathway component PulK
MGSNPDTKTSRGQPPSSGRRVGLILVAVLWIVAVIGFIGVGFAFRTNTDLKAGYYVRQRMQAQLLAESAIERARALLASVSQSQAAVDRLGDGWDDAPDLCADQTLEGLPEGVYSLIGRIDPTDQDLRYGLVDENSKIDLNTATRDMLLKLPGMTEEIADSIIDWRDPDDTPGPRGAESAYYLNLRHPYQCKNAAFESVDELLLVRGMTSSILYGEDANRNGLLDPNEDDADASPPADNRDGVLNPGLYRYLTVWSQVPNTDAAGRPRININGPAQQVAQQLQPYVRNPRFVAAFTAYRRTRTFQSIGSLYDLPGMTDEIFAALADHVTTSAEQTVRGLVNPNTAPAAVLLALPGMTEQDVAGLIALREQSSESQTSIAWVRQVVGGAKFSAIAGLLTPRSYRFSCEALGRFTDRPVFKRLKVILDRSQTPATVVYWQDLSGLGPAYPPPDLSARQVKTLNP